MEFTSIFCEIGGIPWRHGPRRSKERRHPQPHFAVYPVGYPGKPGYPAIYITLELWSLKLRLISSSLLISLTVTFNLEAYAQCWPFGRDLSAVELTACFMAEYQRCEELVPGFTNRAARSISNFTNNPKFREITKSKDFDRFRKDAYKNLVATKWYPGDGCNGKLRTLENGRF